MFNLFKQFVASLLGLHTAEEMRIARCARNSLEYSRGVDAATAEMRGALQRAEEQIEAMRESHRQTPVVPIYSHRLTGPVYEALERELSQTIVNNTVSPEMVAHQLGVQHALATIRKGYVTPFA